MKKGLLFGIIFIGFGSHLVFAQSMIIRDSDSKVLMEVADEGNVGSIMLPDTNAAPVSTINKLYNLDGALYWNGVDVSSGFSLPYAGSTASTSTAFHVTKTGTGRAAQFENSNASNGGEALYVKTVGTGKAMSVHIENAGNTDDVLNCETNGSGGAGFFRTTHPSSAATTLTARQDGDGYALRAQNTGTAGAGIFEIVSASNTHSCIDVGQNGLGHGIYLQINNTSNNLSVVSAVTNGTNSSGVFITHTGEGNVDLNNYLICNNGSSNDARINHAGTGYFNGGTFSSGADLAETFEVEGDAGDYESGDVLEISRTCDRRVTKSTTAYSTLVAGVYATKPGVVLSDRSINDSLEGTVPLGMIGVVPTKVSGENGAIERGDLLVSASVPGHAMKGTDQTRMPGAVIGKALENFEEAGTGVIQVLVTVR